MAESIHDRLEALHSEGDKLLGRHESLPEAREPQKTVTKPHQLLLMLHFSYSLASSPLELVERPENLGLLLPPSSTPKEFHAQIDEALSLFNADPLALARPLAWRAVQLPFGFANSASATLLSVSGGSLARGCLDNEQIADALIRDLAAEAGQRLLISTQAIGWRRGESSNYDFSSLEAGFADLESLYHALELRSELDSAAHPGSPPPARPWL